MRVLIIISALLRCCAAFFRSRNQQAIVELALRQQLATYAQTRPKPKLTPLDRAFWVVLFRLWSRWKEVLVIVIVKPDTVDGFWFLVRGVNCGGSGSYDTGEPSQVGSRDAEIAGSGADCP